MHTTTITGAMCWQAWSRVTQIAIAWFVCTYAQSTWPSLNPVASVCCTFWQVLPAQPYLASWTKRILLYSSLILTLFAPVCPSCRYGHLDSDFDSDWQRSSSSQVDSPATGPSPSQSLHAGHAHSGRAPRRGPTERRPGRRSRFTGRLGAFPRAGAELRNGTRQGGSPRAGAECVPRRAAGRNSGARCAASSRSLSAASRHVLSLRPAGVTQVAGSAETQGGCRQAL